jgi:catechol 2,3-dioxygenase-like lactoylglutathione lyase family enzyme
MRGLTLFVAGAVLGMLVMQLVAAPGDRVVALSHVGISVRNFDESIKFYTKTMGFREAFSFRQPDGKPALTMLQISRDTFLEVTPSSATQPAGCTHFALELPDINGTTEQLRQQGFKVNDPRPGRANAPLTNVFDPDGIRVELLQLVPESLHRKAMDSWK